MSWVPTLFRWMPMLCSECGATVGATLPGTTLFVLCAGCLSVAVRGEISKTQAVVERTELDRAKLERRSAGGRAR